MYRCILVLALFALAACAAAPTRADLEAALLQDGDLPAGWEAGQYSAPGKEPPIIVSRELIGPLRQAGFVGATLHASAGEAQGGHAALVAGLGLDDGEPVDGLGERSTLRAATVAWQRCRASAAVSLPGEDRDALLRYARRLDERLRTLAC